MWRSLRQLNRKRGGGGVGRDPLIQSAWVPSRAPPRYFGASQGRNKPALNFRLLQLIPTEESTGIPPKASFTRTAGNRSRVSS
eukprot:6569039-Pyramimonas_sp.AAC.1